jgi:hypothetical protein
MSRPHHPHGASRAGMRRPAARPPKAGQPRPAWPAGAIRLGARTAAQTLPRHAVRADPCGVKAASGGSPSSGQSPSPPAGVHHARRAWSGESEANAGVFVRLPEGSQQSAEGRSSPAIVSRWRAHWTARSLSAPSVALHIPKTGVARANPRFAWVALAPGTAALCRGELHRLRCAHHAKP